MEVIQPVQIAFYMAGRPCQCHGSMGNRGGDPVRVGRGRHRWRYCGVPSATDHGYRAGDPACAERRWHTVAIFVPLIMGTSCRRSSRLLLGQGSSAFYGSQRCSLCSDNFQQFVHGFQGLQYIDKVVDVPVVMHRQVPLQVVCLLMLGEESHTFLA